MAGIQGLTLSEQAAGGVSSEGGGGAEGSSAIGDGGPFHACLMLTLVLIPCWIQFYLPS